MARKRRYGSIKFELLKKSREAAIAAVQIFNNPNIYFKSELFIVTIVIAWTYFLHAYYRGKKIDYRYYNIEGKRKKYDTTKKGAHKYWELDKCINYDQCPLANDIKINLQFLIGIRHEIEHKMTSNIDSSINAKLQACCLNYNSTIKSIFGDNFGVDKYLSISLQFSSISREQLNILSNNELPRNIATFIEDFERDLSIDEIRSTGYAYRVVFIPTSANREGQADKVVEFIKSDSPKAESINKDYALIKETEKVKYLPSQIVKIINNEGYEFSITDHTNLWKIFDAKNPKHNYGTLVAGKNWFWYENWLTKVRAHCENLKQK
jgi:hypothetical protein